MDERDFLGDFADGSDTRRRRLNTAQTETLLRAFSISARPSSAERERLAEQTGLAPRAVQIWFQNRRAKLKKESTDAELFSGVRSTASSTEAKHVLPVITSRNFKELCLPNYLDIPFEGQLSEEQKTKDEAIRNFWRQQQDHERILDFDAMLDETSRKRPRSRQDTPSRRHSAPTHRDLQIGTTPVVDMPAIIGGGPPLQAIEAEGRQRMGAKNRHMSAPGISPAAQSFDSATRHDQHDNDASQRRTLLPQLDYFANNIDFLFSAPTHPAFAPSQSLGEKPYTDLFSLFPESASLQF